MADSGILTALRTAWTAPEPLDLPMAVMVALRWPPGITSAPRAMLIC